MSSKASKRAEEEKLLQFTSITSASIKDARKYLDKYKRVEIAVDAYYNDLSSRPRTTEPPASTSKLNAVFDNYADPNDPDLITVDGTIKLCEDLGVDPEDVVLLAVAYELKSPRMAEWKRQGWIAGWKSVGCDSIATMKTSLLRLRDKLGSDPNYFRSVYSYTFDFARAEGQRSLPLETAQAFWALLLPHGIQGGALSHITSRDDDGDDSMTGADEGWKLEYNSWWYEFLENEAKMKGVSKDTWMMFFDFVRSIDSKFEKYDMEAAWPSTIDDFVEYAKGRIATGA
ncbi:DUF298-domain-containing protein [Stereum hirsutum FP-91666 SS1]|uniref:DUF298-domain-containing protein n=1 Tax=Stereum hirsutum (strain FP-91666) TaxID=721885 RepID=UPI00044497F8|nr:DUF298-domain-containing protein [Stereum hirsutum FP-91666 SS1]EIM84253.1 DUF298-domain-containing protein [Stereum hirsutum FP-91666 SS1]